MELQTVKEIANIWRIGETKVWSLIQNGILTRYWKGNMVAISKAEFTGWANDNVKTLKQWQEKNL